LDFLPFIPSYTYKQIVLVDVGAKASEAAINLVCNAKIIPSGFVVEMSTRLGPPGLLGFLYCDLRGGSPWNQELKLKLKG
jgi:hypothetical protein